MNVFKKFFFKIALLSYLWKKKFPIEYKTKAPIEIEITEINVPSHLPNKIPEIIKIGDPNPRRATQIIAKKKKNKLN